MNEEVLSYYSTLFSIVQNQESSLLFKYKQLRALLERICREQMESVDLQATDLSARISFMADKFGLSYSEQQRLHTFRLTSNKLMNQKAEPDESSFYRDLKTLSFFVKKISKDPIPSELYSLLPTADATYHLADIGRKQHKKLRVCFQYADEEFLYVQAVDYLTSDLVKVRYGVKEINDEFDEIHTMLWPHAQLNLLDVHVDQEGVLTPRIFVLEPDYLLDISALAECFRPYGAHPLNYILSKLQPINNPRPLLLGSIANHFLDEWIYLGKQMSYRSSMQKVFQAYALQLASCPDLSDKKKEYQFFQDCKLHYDNIGEVVNNTFREEGYRLDKSDAVLEPSYICEALGVQGRLDYMQRDMSSFIEMKSGKADEYAIHNKITPHINHRVQMLLYQAVLYFNMDQDRKDMRAYLLYTRYPLLYPARTSWRMIRQAIHLRNQIVATEYQVQAHNSLQYTEKLLQQIYPDQLNINGLSGVFWTKYLAPQIDSLRQKLIDLEPDERAYFYATYNFITKELYTSKSGDVAYEGNRGASSLWNATFLEKCEEGSILYGLKIKESHAADLHKPSLVLERMLPVESEALVLPNFREGDAIVLYERNTADDNVTNKLVFKGNLEAISDETVKIRLRAPQQNPHVLPADSDYAIEPDSMDTTFRHMYLGLDAFISANKDRRELLLGKRAPEFDPRYNKVLDAASTDLDRIVTKSLAAKDYFLLVGPPGTGKTSFALRLMVDAFRREGKTILLLAYTNQAVNEICKAISRIDPDLNYIRIGSELSCEPTYRSHLLENVLGGCNNRAAVRHKIQSCSIFVSTVASLNGKPELFLLKQFDVAIVDEASQILEPQLLGILAAKSVRGENAIKKFILIGDHKQLPAVVQQKEETSAVLDEGLNRLKLTNLRDALFERLYRLDFPGSIDWLTAQGRMHPEIAQFTNCYFYRNKLKSLNLPHQQESQMPVQELYLSPFDKHLTRLSQRVTFIPAQVEDCPETYKLNQSEAEIAAYLAYQVCQTLGEDFESHTSIGIITPYRSQIALIKSELRKYKTPELEGILVDTVERFQGSEREIIIYSFCVNAPYQLKFLSNLVIEDGIPVDRKLNVALTRARKQLFLVGVPHLLQLNPIYKALLAYVTK